MARAVVALQGLHDGAVGDVESKSPEKTPTLFSLMPITSMLHAFWVDMHGSKTQNAKNRVFTIFIDSSLSNRQSRLPRESQIHLPRTTRHERDSFRVVDYHHSEEPDGVYCHGSINRRGFHVG